MALILSCFDYLSRLVLRCAEAGCLERRLGLLVHEPGHALRQRDRWIHAAGRRRGGLPRGSALYPFPGGRGPGLCAAHPVCGHVGGQLCDPLHEELLVPHLAHLLLRLLRGAGNAFGLREAVAEPRRGHRLHHHGELLRGGLLLQQGLERQKVRERATYQCESLGVSGTPAISTWPRLAIFWTPCSMGSDLLGRNLWRRGRLSEFQSRLRCRYVLLHLRGFYMELLGAGVSADVGDHADCLLSGDYGRLQFGGLVGASTHRGHLKSGPSLLGGLCSDRGHRSSLGIPLPHFAHGAHPQALFLCLRPRHVRVHGNLEPFG
mmetsp:Transcript_83000/g.199160  ORF Transcript_83000/g.199160 Transcript_83000/m.199160 type:complete len:319 (-) Transcript_83000:299-1255(-)